MEKLIVRADLGEFFYGEVTEARKGLGVELEATTEYYLVNLLCEYSKQGAGLPGDEPLALLYKRALEAAPTERVQLYKSLGDTALYGAGFFAEFIESSMVDVDYYVSMGGKAYASVADLTVHRGRSFSQMYGDLASSFSDLVKVLARICEGFWSSANRGDLLKLYERWTRTGDQRIQEQLIGMGLVYGTGSGGSLS